MIQSMQVFNEFGQNVKINEDPLVVIDSLWPLVACAHKYNFSECFFLGINAVYQNLTIIK